MSIERTLSAGQSATLLALLEARFAENPARHAHIAWDAVRARLTVHPHALWSLGELERTEGEPDVVGADAATGAYFFADCCRESPAGRRNLCYDAQARTGRRANAPLGSALEMAQAMGVQLLSQAQYHALQALEPFDERTSSWLETPPAIRALGGALFGDRRYGQAFIYHNGAPSYYAVRGFRAMLYV